MKLFLTNKKNLLIMALVCVFIVILIITYILKRPANPLTPGTSISPTQTMTTPSFTPLTPTNLELSLAPAVNTGALDDNPTVDELAVTNQARELRSRSPYDGGSFQVVYNYATDIFEVRLKEPIEVSREQFASWLQTTYPKISLTRFIIVR